MHQAGLIVAWIGEQQRRGAGEGHWHCQTHDDLVGWYLRRLGATCELRGRPLEIYVDREEVILKNTLHRRTRSLFRIRGFTFEVIGHNAFISDISHAGAERDSKRDYEDRPIAPALRAMDSRRSFMFSSTGSVNAASARS